MAEVHDMWVHPGPQPNGAQAVDDGLWIIDQKDDHLYKLGYEDGSLLEKLPKDKNLGFDAMAGEFTNMTKAGIVDPAKVARIALEMAASVSGLMLTTNVLITELKEDEKKEELVAGAVC